jgi:hypothetical protein
VYAHLQFIALLGGYSNLPQGDTPLQPYPFKQLFSQEYARTSSQAVNRACVCVFVRTFTLLSSCVQGETHHNVHQLCWVQMGSFQRWDTTSGVLVPMSFFASARVHGGPANVLVREDEAELLQAQRTIKTIHAAERD